MGNRVTEITCVGWFNNARVSTGHDPLQSGRFMILDTHTNLPQYAPLFTGLDPAPVFDWLANSREIEPGTKVEFYGDKVFARVLRPGTGGREDFRWEAHREYIDLQYILGGGEVIEWTPAESLVAEGAYEVATDFQYYAPASADALLTMHDGLFTFLFPQDGHKPLVSDGKNKEVHKVVVKIHRSMLSL